MYIRKGIKMIKNENLKGGVITPSVNFVSIQKKTILGLQHTFTMFGATVLVPIITGFDVSVALFMAGMCTLLFHLITKGKVPAFLGSSFAFIAPMLTVLYTITGASTTEEALASPLANDAMAYAQGGIVVAGVVYLIISALITKFGSEKVMSFFPPIVTGPIIMVIGLKLAPTAIDMASSNWPLAIASFAIVTMVSIYARGFLKVLPVLIGLIGGYIIAAVTGNVDFSPVLDAQWLGIPAFRLAKFSFNTIMLVAPVAVATVIEHIGDVLAISETTGNDFVKDPGLNRTMLGDGLATIVSAMFGGPANTTYSENTGVLALTKVYDPVIIRIAAVFAIILGIVPKLVAIISTIPTAVVGGISIILFGMIAAVGARSLVESKIDFTKSRNLIIAAAILVLGLGGASLPITETITVEGMALGAIAGIILNKILPDK